MNKMLVVVVFFVVSGFSEYLYQQQSKEPIFRYQEGKHSESGITFTLDKVAKTSTYVDGYGQGDALSMDYEYTLNPEWGSPSLPILQCFVKIPERGNVQLSIEEITTRSVGSLSIVPFQPRTFGTNGVSVPYRVNHTIYETNAFYPKKCAILKSCEIWREIRVARILINPILYNPVTKETQLVTHAQIKLTYTSTQGENELSLVDRSITPSFLPLYAGVLNCDLNTLRSHVSKKPGSYVFLGTKATLDAVKDLIQWKIRKGFEVREAVVGTDSIAATTDGITKWIANAYKTWPNKPEYLLIVGNDKVAPPKMITQNLMGNTTHPADVYFGVIGDHSSGSNPVPSIHIGRITGDKSTAADDPATLRYIAWKIIRHESSPEDGEWRSKCLSWACKDQQANDNIGLNIQKEWTGTIGTNLTINKGTDKVGVDNGTVMDNTGIVTNLSSGVSLMIVVSHGSETTWGSVKPAFSTTNAKALTNGLKFPFIMSLACVSGNWTKAYSLYETFLSEGSIDKPQGVVSMYGYSTYSTEDTGGIISNALKNYFESKVYHWGAAISSARKFAKTKNDAEGGTLFGCPEVDIYTGSVLNQLKVKASIPTNGTYSVEVKSNDKAVEGALVGIVSNTYTMIGSGFTDASGKVQGACAQVSGDSIYLTVTGHNLKPYLQSMKCGSTGLSGQVANTDAVWIRTMNGFNGKNAGIQISLSTTKPTVVHLSLYTLKGMKIGTKQFVVKSSGDHSLTYKTHEMFSAGIPSGMYVIRLSYDNKSIIRHWNAVY